MLTPENDAEKEALNYISVNDNVDVVIKHGTFYGDPKVFGVEVKECQGGHMRAYEQEDSVMFLLTPKKDGP